MTATEYNSMLKTQDNQCAICKKELKIRKNMAVDHCHASGKVRGILCRECNLGLGIVSENIETLKSMITYLKINNQTL